MEPSYFAEKLFPLQDAVLRVMSEARTGFYLSGGTAASRGYLSHRYSEDLDFFSNDSPDFGRWADRFVQALVAVDAWDTSVALRERRFVRLVVSEGDADLKIEMVDDVPSHIGAITEHPVLGRLDSAENILANKLTALVDRDEPKDLADVWGFCRLMGMSIESALEGAATKAAGLFPVDLARRLMSAGDADWRLIRWITGPSPEAFVSDLRGFGERLLLLPPPDS
jgi:predicted nucleotidyltransferase component of viral defense system